MRQNVSNRDPILLATMVGTVSFVGGILFASQLMRMRDRERLRRACSRIGKHLESTQRTALGPITNLMKPKSKEKVLVVGAGSYGTAMAYICAVNGHDVVMYMRDEEQCRSINSEKHVNSKYLSNYPLNPGGNSIRGICTDEELKDQFDTKGIVVILALPCQRIPDWIKSRREIIPEDVLLVSTAKGLYLPTKQLVGHAILDALHRASQPMCFLSGPSFAEEIIKGNPTSVCVASDQLFLASKVQRIMSNDKNFRVYTSNDPIGVQLGGALKNPLAVGAGMIAGLGFGTNTLSAMVTRATGELQQIVVAMGGDPQTVNGLSGIGDMMLTCYSSQSRNQRCGKRLVQGESVVDIQKEFTVEGVPTADVAVEYADMCGLELPIFRTVQQLIHNEIKPEEALSKIMSRSLKQETSR